MVFLIGGILAFLVLKGPFDIKAYGYLKIFLIFLLGGFIFLGLYLSQRIIHKGEGGSNFSTYVDFGDIKDIKAHFPSSWKSLLILFIVLLAGFSIVFALAFLFLEK